MFANYYQGAVWDDQHRSLAPVVVFKHTPTGRFVVGVQEWVAATLGPRGLQGLFADLVNHRWNVSRDTMSSETSAVKPELLKWIVDILQQQVMAIQEAATKVAEEVEQTWRDKVEALRSNCVAAVDKVDSRMNRASEVYNQWRETFVGRWTIRALSYPVLMMTGYGTTLFIWDIVLGGGLS